MRRTLFSLFLVLFYFVSAQEVLFNQAENLYNKSEWSSAYDLFFEAAEEYSTTSEWNEYIHCNIRMADCLLRMSLFQEGIALADSTLIFIYKWTPTDSLMRADALRIKGESWLNLGHNEKALEQLHSAEKLYPKTDNLPLAECYNLLGITYWNNQNQILAAQYHQNALLIKTNLVGENSLTVADSYNNLGLLYTVSDPTAAYDFFEKALLTYESILGTLHPKVGYCLINMGRAQLSNGWKDQASELITKAEQIWNKLYATDHPAKAFTFLAKGEVFEYANKQNEAMLSYESALQMYVRLFGEKHPEVANTYMKIGSLYQSKSNFKNSIQSYQRAIYANVRSPFVDDVYSLCPITDYYNADILLSSLLSKAKALEALHFEKSLKIRDLKQAIITYQQADTLLNKLRDIRKSESDQLRLGEQSLLIYENGIQLCETLAQQPAFFTSYRKIAFSFSERSKAALLLKSIEDSKPTSFKGLPENIRQLEKNLKDSLALLTQLRLKDPTNKTYQQKEFALNQTFASLQNDIKINYPNYFELKYPSALLSLDEFQNELEDDEIAISYLEGNQTLIILLIRKDKMEVIIKPLPVAYKKWIPGLRNSIYYQVDKQTKNIASHLFNFLLPTLPENTSKIIIFPDGRLHQVPFEVLFDNESQEWLIEKYEISYAYSASLWKNALAKDNNEINKGIAIAAPIEFQKSGLVTLPDSEKESQELKYLFLSHQLPIFQALRSKATEETVKKEDFGQYSYLHLATHGVVDMKNPSQSCIYLEPDSQNDGQLYAGEIYSMSLTSKLVSLSACETGLGQFASGEGILGLTRALTFAGAEQLLVSLWPVADASTAELMVDFYKGVIENSEKSSFSDALRRSKLNLLTQDKWKKPYYWAPFILIGR